MTPLRGLATALPLALITSACGPDNGQPASDDSSSSAADPESTGPQSTGPQSTESSGAPESSGSESSGAPSDSSSESSDSGGIEVGLECEPETTVLVVETDGEQVGSQHTPSSTMVDVFGLLNTFGERGGLFMRAAIGDIYPTTPVFAAGYLRMPEDAPARASEWMCFDDASQYLTDGEGTVGASLHGLVSLGFCPGTPVEGSAVFCSDASCGTPGMSAWIGDASFDAPLGNFKTWGPQGAPGGFVGSADFGEGAGDKSPGTGGLLEFRATEFDPEGRGMLESAVDDGWFIAPIGTPDAGAIYCIGEGSRMLYDAGDGFAEVHSVEMRGLSRLGSCDEVEGDGFGAFCMNQH